MALFFWRSDQSCKSLMRLMLAVVQGIPIVFSEGDGHDVWVIEGRVERGRKRCYTIQSLGRFPLMPCGEILSVVTHLLKAPLSKHLHTCRCRTSPQFLDLFPGITLFWGGYHKKEGGRRLFGTLTWVQEPPFKPTLIEMCSETRVYTTPL